MRNKSPVFSRNLIALGAGLSMMIGVHAQQLTRDNASPVGDNQNSQTAGPAGPVLLQDSQLVEKLQRFDRERIPERVVHARGTGAFGDFVSTADISDLSIAQVFTPGTKTPVFVRFSSVMGYRGSPEQARDPRGFAVKFYTQQGNWDVVGINWPIFFIRDAIKFPDFVHANKPSAVTGVQDANLAFDFFAHTPEATSMLTHLYSDEGMPDSYRKMDGYGVHAFKLVNANGDVHYVKFHWKSQQGIEGIRPKDIPASIGNDWNLMTNDLYGALKAGNDPKWDLYIQVLNPQDLDKFDYDALDDTKVWTDVPERKIGTLTLDRIPDNYVSTPLAGSTQQRAIHKTLDFRQAGEYYRSLSATGKLDLVTALSADLNHVTNDANKYTMLSYFYKADADYGTRLAHLTHADLSRVQTAAASLSE